MGVQVMSRREWEELHSEYKLGDPRKGTAKALFFVEGVGSCLIPVIVK